MGKERCGRGACGFTLIELMIVIAIIAIIAAIAIPGLLQAQRASNERNASASLKSVCTAEADFRANDRDRNRSLDYWTGDVSQLYGLDPMGDTDPVRLLEITVAGADSVPILAGTLATPGSTVSIDQYVVRAMKAGYWYRAMVNDELGSPYAVNQSGTGPILTNAGNTYNTSKFGFIVFPDSRAVGRSVFIVNETHTIFKRPCAQAYVVGHTAGFPNSDEPKGAAIPAGNFAPDYPNDAAKASDWGKLD